MKVRNFVIALLLPAPWACSAQSDSWVDQTGSTGFHVKTPKGWKAEGAKDGHALISSGDGSVYALLQPFKLPQGGKAAEVIGSLVGQMGSLFPGAQLSMQKQISDEPDEAVAKLNYRRNGVGMRANVLCFEAGGVGMLYAVAAPEGLFAAKRPELIKVLESFRYGPAPAAASGSGGLSYTSWTDPNEGAFTVQVPTGWNVSGGLTRVTPFDLRTQIDAVSPGGDIHAQFGDAKMLPFTPVEGVYLRSGIREGTISSNHGAFMFLNYETGAQFSKGYLNLVLSKKYQNLSIGESKEVPELQQAIEGYMAKLPMQPRISSGDTEFTFTENGQERKGVCIVTTMEFAPGTMSQYWIAVPAICTAPADKMRTGLEVLGHISLPKFSQEWMAKANQAASSFTKYVQADAAKTRALHNQMYQNMSNQIAANEDGFRQYDNILGGTQDMQDAQGNVYHVQAGKNFYYKGGGGSILGSDQNVGVGALSSF